MPLWSTLAWQREWAPPGVSEPAGEESGTAGFWGVHRQILHHGAARGAWETQRGGNLSKQTKSYQAKETEF